MAELSHQSNGDRWRERSGRRWILQVDTHTGAALWVAWRLFERVSGVAPAEADALAAIDHFLRAKSTYTLKAVSHG
jgi:hypothetical protein